jgi:hypothetical protein
LRGAVVKYWVVLLLLAGCGAKLARDMNTGLQKFVGQDVKVAIDTLGLPSEKFSLDDQRSTSGVRLISKQRVRGDWGHLG